MICRKQRGIRTTRTWQRASAVPLIRRRRPCHNNNVDDDDDVLARLYARSVVGVVSPRRDKTNMVEPSPTAWVSRSLFLSRLLLLLEIVPDETRHREAININGLWGMWLNEMNWKKEKMNWRIRFRWLRGWWPRESLSKETGDGDLQFKSLYTAHR